jgi:hypothetical protein
MSPIAQRCAQGAPKRAPRQGNNGEIETSAGLKGTDQPNSAGNQLGAGGKLALRDGFSANS